MPAMVGLRHTTQVSRMRREDNFGDNPGDLAMLTYVPSNLERRAPLVVVLHGCGQGAAAYAEGAGWLALADRFGFMVLAPEQSRANNLNRCFNWFEPGDAARGQGEAASIRAMIAQAVFTQQLDPRRIFVTGLSAGAAMAAALLAVYPEVFAGGGLVAGLPYGVAHNGAEAIAAMFGAGPRAFADLSTLKRHIPGGGDPPRVAIWHGDADQTVRASNAEQSAWQWAGAHGLAPKATEVREVDGRVRSCWRSPLDGTTLVELNLVSGLGHGAAIDAAGPDPIGAKGPYLLDAGVSSSLEIARFWRLAPIPRASARQPPPRLRDQQEGDGGLLGGLKRLIGKLSAGRT